MDKIEGWKEKEKIIKILENLPNIRRIISDLLTEKDKKISELKKMNEKLSDGECIEFLSGKCDVGATILCNYHYKQHLSAEKNRVLDLVETHLTNHIYRYPGGMGLYPVTEPDIKEIIGKIRME